MAGSKLPNIGYDYKFKPEEIRRFMLVLYKKDDNTLNKVTLVNAALKATWTALFDVPNFSADTSGKVVCSPLCFGAGATSGEATAFDTNGYFRVLQDGSVDFTFLFYDVAPAIAKQLRSLADFNIAAWPVTQDTKVLGVKDGTDLKPLRIQNLTCPNYTPPTRDSVAILECKFRLDAGSDMNNLVAVQVADADVTDDSDFYSLRDVTATAASPAVTGCTLVFKLDEVDPSAPGTDIYLTSSSVLHSSIKFADAAGGADKALAGAGSLTYVAGTHTFTVNEAALLTTLHVYTPHVTVAGFDITCAPITIP
jgi:hypothetical protein